MDRERSHAGVTPKLAVEGGRPERSTFLPYARQSIDEDDVSAVVEALRSDWLTTGPRVDELERRFAEYVGTRHAVAYANGTAALHGAAFACGLGPGDEVIVPAMTFAASAACAVYVGATPVLADVDAATLNLDPEELERRLTPRTRAVVAVHYAGVPADMESVSAIARRAGLRVIEDAAHAVGARTRGRVIGTLGDVAMFSLHPAKQFTTGEGGIATTDDAELADRLRRFRNHCMDTSGREREQSGGHAYTIEELGFNYRITDIQAALGLSQLRKLDTFLARRRELVARYHELLGSREDVVLPTVRDGTEPAWHLYVVRLVLERLTVDREWVFRALRAENIGVNVHYKPVHQLGFYRRLLGARDGDYPVAEDAYRRILTLPLFPAMKDEDVEGVVRALDKVLTRYARY
jgi:UDP-4-amino-4,6-dideoxy-N-acetyl-beta-L-altrosamine transaminase